MSKEIKVTYDISPATSTTCGDGTGAFCKYLVWSPAVGGLNYCRLFGPVKDTGWIIRHKDCVKAEISS